MISNNLVVILLAAVMSLVGVNWIYFRILRIAKNKNLVDNPDARKLQEVPVPVQGGTAVFFGLMAGMVTFFALTSLEPLNWLPGAPALIGVLSVMLYVGWVDDLIGILPRTRLLIEVLAILALILASGAYINDFHGLWGIEELPPWIGIPLTVFACVGILNAVNMVDGVNGLSSGLCIMSNTVLAVFFFRAEGYVNAMLAACMVAALIPFFIHNVFGNHSRMYIGDAGTMVLGMLMGWFTICLLWSEGRVPAYGEVHGLNPIALALAVVCVPVADTLRVMTMRIMDGKSPFAADKTHLHHAFINVGVSHSVTTLFEITINGIVIALWGLSVELGAGMEMQLYVVIVAAAILVWGMYVFLHYHAVHHTKTLHRLVHFSIFTHLGHTDWWLRFQARLDAPEQRYEGCENIVGSTKKFKFPDLPPKEQKEEDRQRLLDFIHGRAEVYVEEILKKSGAEPLRLYGLIHEEVEAGHLVVIRYEADGVPEIVAESY